MSNLVQIKFTNILCLTFLGLTFTATADNNIKIGGLVRERSTLSNASKWKNNTNDKHELRSRVFVEATTSESASIRVELQDTRVMGSNNSLKDKPSHTAAISEQSSSDAKGVDLHQAYFTVKTGDFQLRLIAKK